MLNCWYIIINPTSGNGAAVKKWNKIKSHLTRLKIPFAHSFSSYSNHEEILVSEALKIGHRKIICVGGDGTLHHIINGIMTQNHAVISELIVGVIPIGTGN
ncbi:MAG: acylglycerol kinase family protein, partial [Bacteroidia bacterium]|nr:acylglycerol kinase family protein [Bacteroidia bacterium]